MLGISVGNIIRRVLRLIREEFKGLPSEVAEETQLNTEHPMMALMMADKPLFSPSPSLDILGYGHAGESSMFNLLANPTHQKNAETINMERSKYELKPILFQGVNELIDEIENSIKQIEAHAYDHINNGYIITWHNVASDVILTIGKSRTLNEFVIAASKKKKFEIIIVETNSL